MKWLQLKKTLNSILFFMIEWWNEMIDENKMN